MVSFLLPRSQTLAIVECSEPLAMLRSEKGSPRISFSRVPPKPPVCAHQRTDSEGKALRLKLGNRNSWLRSITSSFTSSGGTLRSESTPMPLLDAPTHVRRRARTLVDSKTFTSQGVDAEDSRLPDHMRRPELQLRRIQRRDLPPSRPDSNRSSSVERAQKHALWWAA